MKTLITTCVIITPIDEDGIRTGLGDLERNVDRDRERVLDPKVTWLQNVTDNKIVLTAIVEGDLVPEKPEPKDTPFARRITSR